MKRMDADWIINVLKDLQAFADENRLSASSRALDAAGIVVSEEIRRLAAHQAAQQAARRMTDETAPPRHPDAQPRPSHFRRADRPAPAHPLGAVGANGRVSPVRLVASNGERLG